MVKHLPNAVTVARMLAIPLLVALALARRHEAFSLILVASLLGDILDGLLARWLDAATPLGALLDSIADTLLLYTAALGAWIFYPELLRTHLLAFLLVPGLWLAENAAALLRYGRLSSFHTLLSRVAAYTLGIFIGVLFLFGFQPWLLYPALAVFVLATLEEFALLALLPQWRADVRGLAWVLRDRAARSAR